ncbi:MAG: hypothetical protein AB7E32_00275 [Desulfovibrio sp.]
MAYIGCTQKLATEFKDRQLTDDTIQAGIHGWHANLYRFYRRKSVLAVNDETRFAVFLPGLRTSEFQDFENLFRACLKRELLRFGVTKGNAAKVLLALGPLSFGKTHNRSVLGTINDMALCLEVQLQRLGGLPENDDDLDWLSKSINETPCTSKGRRGYFIPAVEMNKLASLL